MRCLEVRGFGIYCVNSPATSQRALATTSAHGLKPSTATQFETKSTTRTSWTSTMLLPKRRQCENQTHPREKPSMGIYMYKPTTTQYETPTTKNIKWDWTAKCSTIGRKPELQNFWEIPENPADLEVLKKALLLCEIQWSEQWWHNVWMAHEEGLARKATQEAENVARR